ncbi:Phosphatidylinositol phosphatase PTPRQ-like isoform X5 [Oopsacas minuta]|uniref:Delta-like protein n=1 Tax=Oopsacas minuta TaxID=111878 RepID=A0AAV7KIZ5_9METZ|nr:Phosphatidylinositol phosphatase PTPRQ-like isoform X5 [Oopsacas minuta]
MKSIILLAHCIILLVYYFEGTLGTGKLTVNYKTYDTKGRDSGGSNCDYCIFCYSPCDPIFRICLRFGHTTSTFTCSSSSVVNPKITSGEYSSTDYVTFGTSIGGTTNPVVYNTDNTFDGRFEISVISVDEDGFFSGDDDIDTTIIRITATKRTSFTATLYYDGLRSSYKTSTGLQYKFICDSNYYDTYCTEFCQANDDTFGHYTCNTVTGSKICNTGYTGTDCDIGICSTGYEWDAVSHSCKDIDECNLNTHQCDQICTNNVGSYVCSCMTDYYLSTETVCSIVTFDTLISGSALSSKSLQIIWQTTYVPTDHTASLTYKLYYRDITFSTPAFIEYGETDQLQQDITGLLPHRHYELYVSAIGSLTSEDSNIVTVKTDEDIPSMAPTIYILTVDSATQISISWSAPSIESQNGIIDNYVILIDSTELTVSASSTFYTITGLNPYTEYTLQIAAATSVGTGPYSTSSTTTTLESTPTSSPLLSVTTITETTITLTLSPPTDTDTLNGVITFYTVTYTGVNVDTTTQTVMVTPSTTDYLLAVDYIVNGLQEGVSYEIQASVSTSVGSGPNTDVITVTTNEIAPTGTPQNIELTTIMTTSLSLSWDSPSLSEQNGVISGYRLSYEGIYHDTELKGISVATTSATIDNLKEGSEYHIHICAVNSMGTGPCISVNGRTLEILPSGSPALFKVENRASNSLSFSWILPLIEERNGYIIAFRLVATDQQTFAVSEAEVSGTEFFYQFTGLEEHREYSILIQAGNSIGYGPTTELIVSTTESSPGEAPLSFTGVPTTNSIALSWVAIPADQHNGQLTYYEITYFTQAMFLIHTHVHTNVSVSEVTYTVAGLEEYVEYYLSIRGYTSVGPGPYSPEINVRTLEALPSSPPTDFTVSVLSATEIQLEYDYPLAIDQNGAITAFDISVSSNTDSLPQIFSTDLTSYTIQSLHPFTSYSIQIRAINSIGAGPYTQVIIAITNQALPVDAPTQLTLSLVTHNSVNFSWNPISSSSLNGEFVSYTVLVTDTQSTTSFSHTSISPNTIIPNLTPYTNYSLSVAVINTQGTGPYSSDLTLSTHQSSPSQGPEILSIDDITDTSAVVQFSSIPIDLQNGPIISYTLSLYISTDSVPVTSVTLNTLSHTLTNLLPYRKYTVEIIATNSAGTSPPSSVIFMTIESVPSGPPTSISATPHSTYVTLRYQPPVASKQNGIIIGYSIQFGTSTSTTTYTTDLTEYTINDLEEYTEFQYSIAASTSIGIGPYSTVLSIKTLSAPPSVAPQNVTGTPESYQSISVSWNHIPDIHQNGEITSYIVYYGGQEHDTSVGKKTVDATNTDTIISPLKPDELYSIIVVAVNSGGISPLSVPIYIRTFEGLPTAAPTEITVVPTSSSSFTVSWVRIHPQHHNGLLLSYEVVYQGSLYDTATLSIRTDVDATSAVVTDLHPAVEYTVYVYALNAIGNGPDSDSATVLLLESVPNVAPSITHSSSGPTWIYVVWQEIDGINRNGVITHYEIRYTQSLDTEYVYFIVSAPVLQANITGLILDTFYTVDIRAYTIIGPGPYSLEVSLLTMHHVCTVCDNGNCVEEFGESICQCIPGFTGDICDTNIDECLGASCDHGTCMDGINSFTCECDNGYQGQLCGLTTATPVCGEETYLNFEWPNTAYGSTAVLPCSDSHSLLFGDASRICSDAGSWLSADVSNCLKKAYSDLQEGLDNEDDEIPTPDEIVETVTYLQDLFCVDNSASLFPAEIQILINVIVNIIDSIDQQDESIRVELLPQVMPGLLCMLSGILDTKNIELLQTNSTIAISINELLERIAKLNADNYDSTNSDPTLFSTENIYLYITPLTNGQSIIIPDYELSAVQDTGLYPNSISIPESEVSNLFADSNGEVPVIAVLFSSYLGQAIGTSSLSFGLDSTSTISTGVISVQNSLGEDLTFSSPITLTLTLFTTPESNLEYTCVYWDNIKQTWTSSGLSYTGGSTDYVSCSSTHATSFSVLSYTVSITDAQKQRTFYAFAGAGVVLLCLVLALVCCFLCVCICLVRHRRKKHLIALRRESTQPLRQPDPNFHNPLYGLVSEEFAKGGSLKKGDSLQKFENPYEYASVSLLPDEWGINSINPGFEISGCYSDVNPGLHVDTDNPYSEIKIDNSANPFTEVINTEHIDKPSGIDFNPFLIDPELRYPTDVNHIVNPTYMSMAPHTEPQSSVLSHEDDV